MDYQYSAEHILSIQLMLDGFSFSIHAKGQSQPLFAQYKSIQADEKLVEAIQYFIEQHPIVLSTFAQTDLYLATSQYVQVPLAEGWIDSDQAYELIWGKTQGRVYENVVQSLNLKTVFKIEESLDGFLHRAFIIDSCWHTAHIDLLATLPYVKSKRQVFALLHPHVIHFVVYVEGKLQLLKTVACSNVSDAVFHTLRLWEALGFDQKKDELIVSVRYAKTYVSCTNQFIKNVKCLPWEMLSAPQGEVPSERYQLTY